jgi:pimeloyl-ACP methyl ester carboxylesterase
MVAAIQALSHAIGRMAVAPTMTEITLHCSDGIKMAAQSWTTTASTSFYNEDDDDDDEPRADVAASQQQRRKQRQRILCLHGWMDNCRSFHHLAPALLQKLPCDAELIALDFPGHGWSSHKSVDGPPTVLAETVYYVAEAVHQLQWHSERETTAQLASSSSGSSSSGTTPTFALIGHSMGAAVSCLYAAAFPEQVQKLVLLEGGTLI